MGEDNRDDADDGAYPPEVEAFHSALARFRAVRNVSTGVKALRHYDPSTYSWPGEFGDLPHALLRRTGGGLPGEVWVHTEFELTRDDGGWLTLEYLAWWVRDSSRGGNLMQLRPMALPPRAHEVQLGTTLKFILDHFFVLEDDDLSSVLSEMQRRAKFLSIAMRSHADTIRGLVDETVDDGLG